MELTNKGCEFDQPIGLWLRVMSAERADIMHGEEKNTTRSRILYDSIYVLYFFCWIKGRAPNSVFVVQSTNRVVWNKWHGTNGRAISLYATNSYHLNQ